MPTVLAGSFRNRVEAGQILAAHLQSTISSAAANSDRPNVADWADWKETEQ